MARFRSFEGGPTAGVGGRVGGGRTDDVVMGAGSYRIADDGREVLRIDCADCAHRRSAVCADCLVTFLCERESDGAAVVPIAEIRAVRLLQSAGLAPAIRHRPARLA